MNWRKLMKHFAAHAAVALASKDYDALVTLRRLAADMAVEMYATDIEKGITFLEGCGVGEGVLTGLRSYYRNRLEALRLRAAKVA